MNVIEEGVQPTKAGKHGRAASVHRRRIQEEIHHGGIASLDEDFFGKEESIPQPVYELDAPKELVVGALVELSTFESKGMILAVLPQQNLVGVELEGPIGNSDGVYNNHRYFFTNKNCAVFVETNAITKILPSTPSPRFHALGHNIHQGDVCLIDAEFGLGIVRYISSHLVGFELNLAIGDSDGALSGTQHFKVKPNYATFRKPKEVTKIPAERLVKKLHIALQKLQELKSELEKGLKLKKQWEEPEVAE